MTEKIKLVRANNDRLMHIVWKIRYTVFTVEQGIPAYLDKDGKDDEKALSILLYVEGKAAGTGRVVVEGHQGILARIAVLPEFRGRGYASEIIQALEKYGIEKGANTFALYPHNYLEKFYNHLGYTCDPGFSSNVAGYSLIRMRKERVSGD